MFSFTSKSAFSVVFKHFSSQPTFGLLIDIDGVLVRGKNVIPGVQETFEKFIVKEGKFSIPTLFLTNNSNSLAKAKAQQLSEWLNVKVLEEQVILAYSPLKVFTEYHEKNTLISGQGPVEEVARQIGFKKSVTIDELRKTFPQLDVVDLERRRFKQGASTYLKFPTIEVIFLNGEPVRWETSLQLITDVLLTNGDLNRSFNEHVYPHIPVLACNPDLHYMAEAHIPRFGHGAFLLCLEALYKKLTGNDLIYTSLVGKPSNATYRYAQQVILDQAIKLNTASSINTLYAIGDNVSADISGANWFKDAIKKDVSKADIHKHGSIQNCHSILVKTGVYTENGFESDVRHVHRDFVYLAKSLFQPDYTVKDISEAIELIINLEKK